MRIRAGERMLIVGTTQTGKSTLATVIASAWERVLVFDPKLDPNAELPNAAIRYGVRAALRALPGRVVYRPTPAEHDDLPGHFDQLVRKVLEGGGSCGIVLHETADAAPLPRSRRWLSIAIRQGARWKIPMIFATQRPRFMDVSVRSESVHVVLFSVEEYEDFVLMAKRLGVKPSALPPLPAPHAFYYRGPGMPGPVVMPPLELPRWWQEKRTADVEAMERAAPGRRGDHDHRDRRPDPVR